MSHINFINVRRIMLTGNPKSIDMEIPWETSIYSLNLIFKGEK
jgi:hypothetical protein